MSQEMQVPLDIDGKIEVITAQMEQKLQMFGEYSDFEEARLFQKSDSSYILEITLGGGRRTRIRVEKSQAQVEALRQAVAEGMAALAPDHLLDQSSRSKFIIWESVLSTFVYGPMIISSAEIDDGAAATGLELIIGGSGFLLPYLLTQHSSVTDGESSLALGGAFNGMFHGSLISLLISDDDPGAELGLLISGISVLETFIGYRVAHSNNLSEGRSDIVRYGGFFGIGQGALLGLLIDPNASPSLIYSASLVGSGLGFAVGNMLSRQALYTRGDATVALTAGIFGTYCAYALIAPELHVSSADAAIRASAAIGLAGNIGGLWLAHHLGLEKDLSTEEGNYVLLGTSAGFLVGTGIGMILSSSTDFGSAYSLTIPSFLGTAAGFGLSYAAFGKGSGKSTGGGWDIQFNPAAAMAALSSKPPGRQSYRPLSQALSVQYHW
jgi:hypothetical protein